MRLTLIRHGQTAWNISGRAQGHTNTPLDPTGMEQVERLREVFAGARVDRLLVSDLDRARATAAPIAETTGAAPEYRTDLRERSFGEWEGLDFRTVGQRLEAQAIERGVSLVEARPPGGESFADVWKRVESLLAELARETGDVVVVTHGGTAAVLAARLLAGTLETTRGFRFANAALSLIERRSDGSHFLVRYNDVRHLAGVEREYR